MTKLTKKLMEYKNNHINWNEFVKEVMPSMRRIALQYSRRLNMEVSDIIAEFYPYFTSMVHRYKDMGFSFDAYLIKSLQQFCKSCYHKKCKLTEKEVLINEETSVYNGLMVSEPDTSYEEEPDTNAMDLITNEKNQRYIYRHILYVLCKNIPSITKTQYQNFASIMGLKGDWIHSVADVSRSYLSNTHTIRVKFRKYRNMHYSKMMENEHMLKNTSSPEKKEIFLKRYRFHRNRWKYYIDRISRQRFHLSNKKLASILGIPKGTIDSALASFQKHLGGSTRKTYRQNDGYYPYK